MIKSVLSLILMMVFAYCLNAEDYEIPKDISYSSDWMVFGGIHNQKLPSTIGSFTFTDTITEYTPGYILRNSKVRVHVWSYVPSDGSKIVQPVFFPYEKRYTGVNIGSIKAGMSPSFNPKGTQLVHRKEKLIIFLECLDAEGFDEAKEALIQIGKVLFSIKYPELPNNSLNRTPPRTLASARSLRGAG